MLQNSSEVTPGPGLAAALAERCGPQYVRQATEADAVDGVQARLVVAPATVPQVSDVMREVAAAGAAVVVRGNGTKLDWGVPPSRADVVLDTRRLDAVIEHAAGDLIVKVQPGVTLGALREALTPAGQRLAVDEVIAGSTVGGVIATGMSGPSRLGYGAVRDLLLGVTVVLADGTVARSGGKVVKNVAGYDLGKLYTGSYGTLGVVVEAVLRLHPIPASTVWVQASYPDLSEAFAATGALLASQTVPAAVEVDVPRPGGPVAVAAAIEGSAAGVSERAEKAAELFGPGSAVAASPPGWWGALPAGPVIKVTAEISRVPSVIEAVGLPARASAGLGLIYAGVPGETSPGELGSLLAAARTAAISAGGSATVMRAPHEMKTGVDVWGPVPAIDLMRRVKQVFDPEARLAPGRFVGGL